MKNKEFYPILERLDRFHDITVLYNKNFREHPEEYPEEIRANRKDWTEEDFNSLYKQKKGYYSKEDFIIELKKVFALDKNVFWERSFYGLAPHESICAVAVPTSQRWRSFVASLERGITYNAENRKLLFKRQEKTELTMQEIADKFNIPVDQLKIKK